MKGQYETPNAFKMALEQRLRNEAKQSGSTISRERQLLVFDRFLARLFTFYPGSIVLKGGLVVELRLQRARTTKDIDLKVQGDSETMLDRLQEAGRLQLEDFLQYEIMVDKNHPDIEGEGMIYQGHRFQAKAMLAGKLYGDPFGIDVAFGEPIFGSLDKVQGSTFLKFAGIEPTEYTIYPLETHIAEKLHAYTMPRTHQNSRVKDLPDLALLGSVRPIKSSDLYEAIQQTFFHRKTHDIPGALPDPPAIWEPVYKRMQQNDGLPWTDLHVLTIAVRDFLDPVLLKESGLWNPTEWCWETD